MSVTLANNPSYLDLMKLIGPDGNQMQVAELLMQTNQGVLDYISFIEGNLTNGHQHAVRTGLPTVSRGRINKGVKATKGNTAQVIDTCAELESLSEIDVKLVEKAPDPAMFRWQQDSPHIEALSQQFVTDLFYGNELTDPDQYTGLAPRYSDSTADNADNIINAFGGDTTSLSGSDIHSIWLIGWSPMTCTGIIPKRGTPNLQQEDCGICWLEDDGSNNNQRMRVYRTYFRWQTGLAIPDWRYVVRIANIKDSAVIEDGSTGPKIPYLMKEAIERTPSMGSVRWAFYMNRRLLQKLRIQLPHVLKQSTLTMENVGGLSPRMMPTIDGIPIFRTDALAVGETKVTFA